MSRDRGEYRAIYEVLFDGKDWCQLTPAARLVWIVLKGTLGAAGINAMPAKEHVLASRTGYATEVVTVAMDELRSKGWIDWDGIVVWVLRGLDFEPTMDPHNKNHQKFIARHLDSLPSLQILERYRASYPDWFPDINGRSVANGSRMASEGVRDTPPITTTTTTPSTTPSTTTSPSPSTEGLPVAGQGYHVRCVVALNRALHAHPQIGKRAREISATEMQGAVTWEAEGVPIDLVERVIADNTPRYRPTDRSPQPSSLRYFDAAVRRAWESQTTTAPASKAPTRRIREVTE